MTVVENYKLSRYFYRRFTDIIEKNRAEAEKCWSDNTSFTDFITTKIREIISKDINGKSLDTQQEYFRIDACAWEQKCSKERNFSLPHTAGYHLREYAWNMKIAVEHENNCNLWMDEVIKLSHIICDLRVVIGYLPYEYKQHQFEYLHFVSQKIQTLNTKDNMSHGEFLVMLGDSGYSKTDSDKWLNYTPYVYNGKYFEPLLSAN